MESERVGRREWSEEKEREKTRNEDGGDGSLGIGPRKRQAEQGRNDWQPGGSGVRGAFLPLSTLTAERSKARRQ